jgi:phosphoenolpyruvate synthase/pyruvate phosphate dikinase
MTNVLCQIFYDKRTHHLIIESILNFYLGFDEICESVMKCWSSQFAFVPIEYKRGYGQLINSPMAVVIQEMVNCDSAGVIFTCNPINGDERLITITANYGLGEVSLTIIF